VRERERERSGVTTSLYSNHPHAGCSKEWKNGKTGANDEFNLRRHKLTPFPISVSFVVIHVLLNAKPSTCVSKMGDL
jgi:hypothetical protein